LKKAVIFDLDGLIVDSEPLHFKAYREALSIHGAELKKEDYIENWVKLGKGIKDFINERNLSISPDKVRKEKFRIYEKLIESELRVFSGAVELIESLQGKAELAIATSSDSKWLKIISKKFNLESKFQLLASSQGMFPSKPDPSIFLHAAQKLNIAPEKCIVLEDAWKGLEAAKRIGMKCIVCPNEFTVNSDFSKADLIVNSLKELSAEKVLGV